MALLAVMAFSSNGCKPDAAVKQGELIGRGTKAPDPPPGTDPHDSRDATPRETPASAPAATGSITGTIIFNGKAPVRSIDISMDPGCSLSTKPTLQSEQFVVKNGKLANVFLYVKMGPPEAMMQGALSTQPTVLDQKNCQYVPHVVGVIQGGYVEFRNSDPTMHNIHTLPTDVGNETIDMSQGPHGQPKIKQFRRPELMIPVRCNIHPWMNAFINVAPTPFFAVSDANGHFDLRGLPPGTYTLGAVHEKMGEKTMQVTVSPKTTAKAEFSFAAQ